MRLGYHILDVFTGTRFGGNPLAVVLDADGLDGTRMQTVAREFNRRIKRRFDELGIELPVPQQRVIFSPNEPEAVPDRGLVAPRRAVGES